MNLNVKRLFWLTLVVALALTIRFTFEVIFDFYSTKYSFTQFINIFLRLLVTILVVFIWLGIVIRSDSYPSKLPWLLILSFEPFLGLAIFLTFGRSFKKSFRYQSRPLIKEGAYLTNEPLTNFDDDKFKVIDSEVTDIFMTSYNMTKHSSYIDDSKVTVLTNGQMFFPKLIEELTAAKKFILMQFYIIKTDVIGKKVLSILAQKAKEGVHVKLYYDAIGSGFLERKFMKMLKESGVEILVNDKVYFGIFNTRINYRNHRKTTIIDSKKAFIGGMNLGDEYNDITDKLGYFRDSQLMLEGKIINSLTALFFRDWYYSSGNFIEDPFFYQAERVNNKGIVQIIPSGPDYSYPTIRNTYVKMINNAKHSIKIMTPYLALDQEMLTSLVIAAKGGVDVNIIVPGKPDYKLVYIVTKSFFEYLLAAGIKIHVYKNTFTHAKVFIVDDNIASCGTYNLDNRSARINFEATVLMFNEAVDKLVEDYEIDMSKCQLLSSEQWRKRGLFNRFIEGLFNLFAPIV